VKHVGLFGALCHRRYAQLNGFDDALFVDASSFVSEGATWNIGFFDGDQVIWPTAPILPGVTMRLLDQAHDRTTTQPVTLSDVPRMVAAFATNTTIGIRPIITIDDDQLRTDHPIIDILRKEYEDVPPERF
jgi:branched-subunit amino acid aminotransferase/4-amino-4-deoxychorismate lyase